MTEPERANTPPDGDDAKSWAHQVTVGIALVVVSLFFFPEALAALGGDSGNFLFRATDSDSNRSFGAVLTLLSSVMLIAGAVFVIKGLRKRKAELHGQR